MSIHKKREKKKFKRQNIRLQNIEINEVDYFDSEEISEEKRADKKTQEKGLKTQKSNLNLQRGRILEIKSNYRALVEINGAFLESNIGGRLKQINFETRNPLAVGDFVHVNMCEDTRIEEILPRRNSLSRFLSEDFQTEIIVAANIDQLIITCSIFQPEIRFGLIDRYLCSAELNGIKPVICVNKIDLIESLSPFEEMFDFYKKNGYQVILTSVLQKKGLEELKCVLKDKESVFSGHSGAGKSSLMNALQPSLKRRVSEISESTQKGVHTTTSSCLIKWDFGGYLVDTPGIKTFGLHSRDKQYLPRIFPGFAAFWRACKYPDCTHTHEVDCAIKQIVEDNEYPWERYDSYCRIFETL
jgi:ribosome biogenesis GTPase